MPRAPGGREDAVVSPTADLDSTAPPMGSTDRDLMRRVAKATATALAVVALAFGLWQVRTIAILLLLSLTFAAAMRPGVEWLQPRRVPEPVAILLFFVGTAAILVAFFWFAIPPAVHEVQQALSQRAVDGVTVRHSTGIRHDVLVWLNRQLTDLPSGSALIHPVAAYGHKATDAIAAVLFTLAATWYWVAERDSLINLLTALAPAHKREKARETFLTIDRRLGSYTRLKFMMIFVIGALLSAGFYVIGLNYWRRQGSRRSAAVQTS